MTWLAQHSLNLANAGFSVLLIAVALVLLRPVEAKKKLKNGIKILIIGVLSLLVGYFSSYLNMSGMEVLTATGASLIVASFFEFIQYRIDIGKGKWRSVHWGVVVACAVGAILILLSVAASNWQLLT